MEAQNQPGEIRTSPQTSTQTAPVVSLSDWMVTILLLAIPVVNLIMLFVWAFGGGANPSKSNFAKATLIWTAIGIAIYLLIFVLIIGALMSL